MNLTLGLLKFVADSLRERAGDFYYEDEDHEILVDAADALDEARELLEEIR